MSSIIRSVIKEDFVSLEELFIQSVENHEYDIQNSNLRAYIMYNKDLVKVAIHKKELIGFIISYMSTPQKAKIFTLFVSQSYRRRGIGKNLFSSLERELSNRYRDLKYLSVRIPDEFKISSHFFRKLDFKTVTNINNYYKKDLTFPFSINNSLLVRKARKKDLNGMLTLETECFSEFWRMDRKVFSKIMKYPLSVLYVALLDDKIVGYNYNTLSASGLDGNYVRIATDPSFLRKGIATTLTYHAFAWFKEKRVNQVLLSTYADSSPHNEMYCYWGFKKIDQEEIMAKQYV
ncbi:MAG: GNAT family N-acetyltransferase [Candidatus Hodarchaeales archaeon]